MSNTPLKIMKEGIKMLGKTRKVGCYTSILTAGVLLLWMVGFKTDGPTQTIQGVLSIIPLIIYFAFALLEWSHLLKGESNTLFAGCAVVTYVSFATLLTLHFHQVGWPQIGVGGIVTLVLFHLTWPIANLVNFLIGVGEKYGSRTRVIEREIFHQ